jgi:flagellar basal-body rod protein FlgB
MEGKRGRESGREVRKNMFGGSFGRNLDIIAREMSALTQRYNVTANNVANADTPNFKRSVVNFESQLKRALDSEITSGFPQVVTNERHIPFDRVMDYRDVRPRRVLDYLTEAKNNGNNVDIEEESMNAVSIQLLYNALAQSVSSAIQRVNIVLR